MKGRSMLKPIAIATAVSGTLDILFAMILTVFFGREVGNMLRYVGSGPIPPAMAGTCARARMPSSRPTATSWSSRHVRPMATPSTKRCN